MGFWALLHTLFVSRSKLERFATERESRVREAKRDDFRVPRVWRVGSRVRTCESLTRNPKYYPSPIAH